MKKRAKRKAAPGKRLGRPPKAVGDKRQVVSFTLPPVVVEYLNATENKSQTIEDALRRSKAFRDWLKARK